LLRPLDKLRERSVAKKLVPLQSQIGGVDLQQETAFDDAPVLRRQRGRHGLEILAPGPVVAVLHDRRHDAWRRRRHEGFREGTLPHQRTLRLYLGRVPVGVRPDGGGRGHEIDLGPTVAGQLLEVGMVQHVALLAPLSLTAESGHTMLHIGDEAFACLFAVVADINAGLHLGGHRPSRGFSDRSP
jgi:hypothetical protein